MLMSVCLCTYIPNEKRLEDLKKVLKSLYTHLQDPVEVVIVDDVSPRVETKDLLRKFKEDMESERKIHVELIFNISNLKHPASQNKSMQFAKGDVLIHIEDDIVVNCDMWNWIFAKCLQDHPEVGQVLPSGSGRGEWIPRPGYNEFTWGLGGLWAIRREVFEKIGGWDESLVHQVEPDYNIRVRMAGWRVAQIDNFAMTHLGEGDFQETFERQAQIHVGVYNFLKKWNRRFFGTYSYRDVWTMSPDDFPINVAFRRQLAAWFAAQGAEWRKGLKLIEEDNRQITAGTRQVVDTHIKESDRCRLNENPEPFKFPGHWGQFELVKLIRPPGRERENELIEKMANNFVFNDIPQLPQQIKDLAERMGKSMTDEQVAEYLKGKQVEYTWEPKVEYF